MLKRFACKCTRCFRANGAISITFGRPEEFARLVAYIAENSYLNGEVIRLDGGIPAWLQNKFI